MCQVAKDVRALELQSSANAEQRVAAHKRHVALVRELKDQTEKRIEKGVLGPLESKIVGKELKDAEDELLRAQIKK